MLCGLKNLLWIIIDNSFLAHQMMRRLCEIYPEIKAFPVLPTNEMRNVRQQECTENFLPCYYQSADRKPEVHAASRRRKELISMHAEL